MFHGMLQLYQLYFLCFSVIITQFLIIGSIVQRVKQIGKIKSFSLDELLTFVRDRGRLGSALKHIDKRKSGDYTTASRLDGCKVNLLDILRHLFLLSY